MSNKRLAPVLLFSLLLSACGLQPVQSTQSVTASEQVRAQLELGLAYLAQEQLIQARQHLERAQQFATTEMVEWSRIHYALALIEMRTGTGERAEHHFLLALNSHRSYPEAENGYGVLLCQQGRGNEAETYFLRAINNPRYATPEVAERNRKACGEEQQ